MKYSDVLNKKAADLGATIEGGSYDDYYKQYMESDSVKRRKRLARWLPIILGGVVGAAAGAGEAGFANARSKILGWEPNNSYATGIIGGGLAGTGIGALLSLITSAAANEGNKMDAWRYAAMRGNNRKALV